MTKVFENVQKNKSLKKQKFINKKIKKEEKENLIQKLCMFLLKAIIHRIISRYLVTLSMSPGREVEKTKYKSGQLAHLEKQVSI